ncbi:MAG TPA: queuosine salvage family protein [Thermomicrobiales bacterium]|nr:queuosine salvage family protein [Thermomicrobiales bacterium]
MLNLELERDPLRVLESTQLVLEQARFVTFDLERAEQVAEQLAAGPEPPPDWSATLHPPARNAEELANLVLVVDALNFCFWSVPGAARPRWQVTYDGVTHDGYWALAATLRRAVEAGRPLADPEYLTTLNEDDVADILAGDPGTEPIPLLHARHQHLHEVGVQLLARWDGSFLRAVEGARGSAPRLIHTVLNVFPSFRDVALWNGHKIRFYKRAQILIADLFGAFEGQGPGAFHDMHTLTAFADYKAPQTLRRFGVLSYAPDLARAIDEYRLIPPDSDEELEIRAATVWGVELLRQSLARRGRDMPSYAIDWILWRAGQDLPADAQPYHRTLTVFY